MTGELGGDGVSLALSVLLRVSGFVAEAGALFRVELPWGAAAEGLVEVEDFGREDEAVELRVVGVVLEEEVVLPAGADLVLAEGGGAVFSSLAGSGRMVATQSAAAASEKPG